MFDFAWSEIMLIGVVALVAIGPKDLPVALKTVSDLVKKARRMAGEFQSHVDEMVRDADLQGVKSTFDDLRRMDIKSTILNAVDGDGGLRKTLSDNPFDINPAPPPVPVHDTPAVAEEGGALGVNVSAADVAEPDAPGPPPSFIPPAIAATGPPGPPAPPPAFVPPAAVALATASRRVPFA